MAICAISTRKPWPEALSHRLQDRVVGRLFLIVIIEKERVPLTGEIVWYPGIFISDAPCSDIGATGYGKCEARIFHIPRG